MLYLQQPRRYFVHEPGELGHEDELIHVGVGNVSLVGRPALILQKYVALGGGQRKLAQGQRDQNHKLQY